MSVIKTVPDPNIWEQICKEFSKQRPPFLEDDDDALSVQTDYSDFDPARHNPVFYGKMFAPATIDEDVEAEFDAAASHPSCVGYTFSEKPPKQPSPPPPMCPNKDECSPTLYLNHYVFPWLLPALEAMLKQAKLEKCFEPSHKEEKAAGEEEGASKKKIKRRRTKFNACDFITEYLYKNNPNSGDDDRSNIVLWDIPFVKEWLKDHPRPPLPKSLIWTDEEAALIIQCYWRGYLVRRDPEVQELRTWQREWQEENRGIQNRVNEFWEKKMPHGEQANAESQPTTDDEQTLSATES